MVDERVSAIDPRIIGASLASYGDSYIESTVHVENSSMNTKDRLPGGGPQGSPIGLYACTLNMTVERARARARNCILADK